MSGKIQLGGSRGQCDGYSSDDGFPGQHTRAIDKSQEEKESDADIT